MPLLEVRLIERVFRANRERQIKLIDAMAAIEGDNKCVSASANDVLPAKFPFHVA